MEKKGGPQVPVKCFSSQLKPCQSNLSQLCEPSEYSAVEDCASLVVDRCIDITGSRIIASVQERMQDNCQTRFFKMVNRRERLERPHSEFNYAIL